MAENVNRINRKELLEKSFIKNVFRKSFTARSKASCVQKEFHSFLHQKTKEKTAVFSNNK